MIYILVLPLKKIYCSPSAINQKTDFPAPFQTDTLLYSMRETPRSGGYEGLTHTASSENSSEVREDRQISCQYDGT